MRIKRFEAKTMLEALRQVKDELGEDAVILSARSLKRGRGVFGQLKQTGVEVTAAAERPKSENIGLGSPDIDRALTAGEGVRTVTSAYRENGSPTTGSGRAESCLPRTASRRAADEITDNEIYRRLLSQDVEEEYAWKITSELLSGHGPERLLSDESYFRSLARAFENVGIAGSVNYPLGENRKLVALMGPSGVGKTATAAKLAAFFTLRLHKKVALVSLDRYRVAAADQLGIYAEIIRVPFATASGRKELRQVVRRFRECDLVLIDTPAISPAEPRTITELEQCLECVKPDEVHLLVSAAARERDVVHLFRRVQHVRLNRLTFTKVDEAASSGGILNVIMKLQLPVGYLSNGQEVPESLRPADTRGLVEMIFGSGFRRNALEIEGVFKKRQKQQIATAETHYVANLNTDVYHVKDCKSMALIKEDNIVVFRQRQEAEAMNFKPCRVCCRQRLAAKLTPVAARMRSAAGGLR